MREVEIENTMDKDSDCLKERGDGKGVPEKQQTDFTPELQALVGPLPILSSWGSQRILFPPSRPSAHGRHSPQTMTGRENFTVFFPALQINGVAHRSDC